MITVGMNYEVHSGKEAEFEQVFGAVVKLIESLEGHGETHLYKDVSNSRMYLVVSQWSDRAAFDAFIASDRFKKVADWGKSEILASKPKHEVYGDDRPIGPPADAPPGCPMHS